MLKSHLAEGIIQLLKHHREAYILPLQAEDSRLGEPCEGPARGVSDVHVRANVDEGLGLAIEALVLELQVAQVRGQGWTLG